MSTLNSLSDLIKENGLTEEDLNQPVKVQHHDKIALQVGKDWELLAPFIEIEIFEVDDIKKAYWHPRDMRVALLREWKKKCGNDATYAKLIYALEQIGNRELTESLISLLRKYTSCNETETNLDNAIKTRKRKQCSSDSSFLLVLLLIPIIYGCIHVHAYLHRYPTPFIETPQVHTDSAMVKWSPKFHNGTNCSQPVGHDLPILDSLFVGREDDIRNVTRKALKANTLNINGAPGFGKSTLAIHAGYRLVQDCVSVRYINIEELSSKILSEFTDKCTRNFKTAAEWKSQNKYNRKLKQTATLTSFTSSLMTKEYSINSESSMAASSYIEELQEWSKDINHTTVLIFDNADDILASSFRKMFIDQINLLVHNSNFRLHIIVVSQEKLLLLEKFDRWIVKELSQQASVKLLSELVPGIANSQWTKISHLLQGCPLALKVIGNLIKVYGQDIIYELENELQQKPIDILDKVSDEKQRFSAMMDLILSKLKIPRKCGYMVSLFPGSFSREAGIEILSSRECLEIFEKQSLLDDYFLAHQRRYKMHRLIREYLKEKVNGSDTLLFETQFYRYYIRFLLNFYTKERELNDVDEHLSSSESKNIDFLEEMLLSSSREKRNILLGEIANQVSLVCKEKFQLTFKIYTKILSHISELINPVVYEEIVSWIMKRFYIRCKCENVTEYFQKIFDYQCGATFRCEQIKELYIRRSSLNLSQQEEEFWHNVAIHNCLFTLPLKLSYPYYIKYLVIIALIFLTSFMLFWCEKNQGALLHAYCQLHLKNKLLVTLSAVILLPSILLTLYQVAKLYGDMLLTIEIGIKLLGYVSIFVSMYMSIFRQDLFYSYQPFLKLIPQYVVKHMLTIRAKSILTFSLSCLLSYYCLKGFSHLPICH